MIDNPEPTCLRIVLFVRTRLNVQNVRIYRALFRSRFKSLCACSGHSLNPVRADPSPLVTFGLRHVNRLSPHNSSETRLQIPTSQDQARTNAGPGQAVSIRIEPDGRGIASVKSFISSEKCSRRILHRSGFCCRSFVLSSGPRCRLLQSTTSRLCL
jgi:hypothetical protein